MTLALCAFASLAQGQGFAGLGSTASGYALPDPETRFTFPADHGPHPDFRIEWWYVTANLTGDNGQDYGIQWTLFRNALTPSGNDEDQAWMGHAAISSPKGHFVAERLARGGFGLAGVTASPFEAFIDEWQMTGADLSNISLTAQGADFAFDMKLTTTHPFVPQGAEGYSVKSESGLASHYYSQPFYDVTGTLILPEGSVTVTGNGWLDREWSSQPLAPDQTGWDWISLHLDTGEKLMGYRLRSRSSDAYTVGTWIGADGTPSPLGPGDLAMTPIKEARIAGREVPVTWDVTLPSRNLAIRLEAHYPDSWMDTSVPYWEGPVRFTGTHSGQGYLEMSGYE